MFSPRLYIALVPLLYGCVLLLPLFTVYFQHQGQTAALFLLSFYWALVAVFWPGLRPRHLLWTVPVYLLVFPLLRFLPVRELVALVAEPRLAEVEYHARIAGDFLLGLAFQSFAALVAAAGLSFQAKRARLLFRRAASDEDERMALYEITSAAHENPELSFYRYKTLLGNGFGLVAEQNGRLLGVVHALLLKDELFLYGLSVVAEARPGLAHDLLLSLLRRPELPTYAGMRWYFWAGDNDPVEIASAIQRRGFKLLGENDPRLTAARELLEAGLRQEKPFPIRLGPGNVWLREIT